MNHEGTLRIVGRLLFVATVLLFAACGGGGGGATDSGAAGVQAVAAKIVAPAANTQVTQGDWVDFRGSCVGGVPPYRYLWSYFGGAAASSTAQNPGSVTFNTPGTYAVVFQASDTTGIASTTSDSAHRDGQSLGHEHHAYCEHHLPTRKRHHHGRTVR